VSEAKRIEIEAEDLRILLSFCPTEAPVPGLCPSFYNTLKYADDKKLFERVQRIREMVARV
jgi:hypothetical protein